MSLVLGWGVPESEESFEAAVEGLAEAMGFKVYHTRYSLRSKKGFPDLVMVRPPRVIFAELKSARGTVSDDQRLWLEVLALCPGVESYIWQPKDWVELERTLRRVA